MILKIFFSVMALFGSLVTPTAAGVETDLFYHAEMGNRVVGGTVAADASAPYTAALTIGWLIRNLVCGGSLITQRHVLTAAHCIRALYTYGCLSWSARVVVGSNDWNNGHRYRVIGNVTHPEYSPLEIKNDISILITRSKMSLSYRVQPCPLTFDYIGAGIAVRAVGWGTIRNGGPISNNLLELALTTIDIQECVKAANEAKAKNVTLMAPFINPDIEICAYNSPGYGMCFGDSGSPLVLKEGGAQVGIVSWGQPCAIGAPDVFVRISAYKDWLEESLKSSVCSGFLCSFFG